MKKLFLALILCLAAACQSDTSYTRKPLFPDVETPRLTPAKAVNSVFKVTLSIDGETDSSGTAWVASYSKKSNKTYLVTAGHVCNADVPAEEESDGARTYELLSQNDQTYDAVEVKRTFRELGDDLWPVDLCVLSYSGYLADPLVMADRAPAYGEAVYYVGAPVGIYGNGAAPTFTGTYSGGQIVSILGMGGASGSAFFTSRGVIGVLVAGHRRFQGLFWLVSQEHLVDYIQDLE
jgi:hypothetical protein